MPTGICEIEVVAMRSIVGQLPTIVAASASGNVVDSEGQMRPTFGPCPTDWVMGRLPCGDLVEDAERWIAYEQVAHVIRIT
jgi:hypothetical protein